MRRPLDPAILRAAQALRQHDVTPQQAVILDACSQDPPPTMTALAVLCGVTTAAMTGTIDRMVAFDWVLRQSIEGDRRSIQIVTTAVGEAKVIQLNNAISTL